MARNFAKDFFQDDSSYAKMIQTQQIEQGGRSLMDMGGAGSLSQAGEGGSAAAPKRKAPARRAATAAAARAGAQGMDVDDDDEEEDEERDNLPARDTADGARCMLVSVPERPHLFARFRVICTFWNWAPASCRALAAYLALGIRWHSRPHVSGTHNECKSKRNRDMHRQYVYTKL
jgi:hypothetical protein